MLVGLGASAAELSVAVAANFTAPMQKIAAAFEQTSGHRLALAFGATGKFYAQIKHGAPFTVLLAADAATPARLEEEGLAVAGSRFTYAIGKLVLWSRQAELLGEGKDEGKKVLSKGEFAHLAIADPKLAPYGAAAMQTLTRLGLADALQSRLVYGESIGQAYQFVASGNAELGFVALAQVLEDGKLHAGSAWMVPDQLYEPIRQDAVILRNGSEQAAAAELLEFLRSSTAQDIIRAYGYGL